jgi:hypothetical protein
VNQSGQKEWNATWGDSTFWSTPFSIVVSADGVYASGENVSNPGLYQHMASKHSRTGTNLWQRVYFSTNGYNRVPRVFLDSRSNLFLSAMTDETNSSSDDIIVARIDASSGSMLWNRSYGTVSDDSRFYAGFGVADTSGDLFTIINSTSTGVRFARFGTTPGTTALSWS